MSVLRWPLSFLCIIITGHALRYDPSQVEYNINTNQTAESPIDYWGEWENHTFTPSPSNWRFPFYTISLDRFANGNPSNDDANGTQFEHDVTQTQLRHGGDIKGLQDSLDYLQGMGIKGLYLAGSPFINEPWAADGYSPLDHTVLDPHFGTIADWQSVISDIHARGMYIILDNTMSTMGDLIGFEGYLNVSTPFRSGEHNALWKSDRRYNDFSFGNHELAHCDYPTFYGDDGKKVTNLSGTLTGCRDSEFDQYGEVAAFGEYPEWQRQISKFAFVQDRLREWRPDVLAKLENFACMALASLDIDGYRIDKGLTITVDAMAHWSHSTRACAKRFGKENFFISGEVVSGNTLGSVYIGRGRTPDEYLNNITEAVMLDNTSDQKYFIREAGLSAFDGVAFHYTVYRFLSRFLGLDGTYAAEGDPFHVSPIDFWRDTLLTNDLINANDGTTFDPRHMYGVTNQDVFRWPTIENGIQKQLLGYFIVALLLPGIPMLLWGEEQAFYVLDSTASNYVFGRSPMTSAQAWGMHGCYNPAIGNSKYYEWPLEAGLHGCQDEWVNLDHRDPSHPVRNFIKRTHEIRENYHVFQDGFSIQLLSNHTREIFLPGSNHTPTETGIWSVERAGLSSIQENMTQVAWLVYTNEDSTTDNSFNCSDQVDALLAPFGAGSTVRNNYPPYDEYVLEASSTPLDDKSNQTKGCLSNLQFQAWGFKAFLLKADYVDPSPTITKFVPGHDSRILSTPSIPIEFHFSIPMDCERITKSLQFTSSTGDNTTPTFDARSVICENSTRLDQTTSYLAGVAKTTFIYRATLINVSDGIHQISIANPSSAAYPNITTQSRDHFLLRVGQKDNPMVFASANHSSNLLSRDADNSLHVSHKAAGADQFRYSLDFGTTYSAWQNIPSGSNASSRLAPKLWSGTKLQRWDGEHVILQYWNKLVGSSDHVQSADVGIGSLQREFPHVFLEGTFNQHGYDAGFANELKMETNNTWTIGFFYEWPAQVSLNIWGMNPDGQPDQSRVLGDLDGDYVLDRIQPRSLTDNVFNLTGSPPSPYLGWQIAVNDASYRYQLIPIGSRWNQLAMFILLWLLPILCGSAAVWLFVESFYGVKINEVGATSKKPLSQRMTRRSQKFVRNKIRPRQEEKVHHLKPKPSDIALSQEYKKARQFSVIANPQKTASKRLTVLIATMEYEIEDWAIKVKIGGLGVMSSLMGKHLKHQNLIWVVPCIGDVDYPIDRPVESIAIKVLGNYYEIKTQLHELDNITFVLLDAPIFRQQTKAEPYPSRMDDLDSAVYYSAWNSCIAEVMRRFPIDLYHINDYHGAIAPLHLLPKIVPCLLSLHNAEFQGLWPMRSDSESQEVCDVYNLDPAIVQKYVRFGEVFNLLHAAASYLRIHQKGFGAVGVSNKYGKRAFARYPIFWGMKDIGGLANPDPTDVASWYGAPTNVQEIGVDEGLEASKPKLKRQAQNWAGLKQDPEAELFVFIGRWSNQKGVDAIADVFPSIMERHPQVQLICVGPVIDLYGKFAALKLARMMKTYKGRVFSQPEFTAVPPYIFGGADFALMPSRDEPFGLVAVEFGRKGVLCIGARVGGLGNMPGWWFTIESTTTKHFINQFKTAIEDAIKAKPAVRALMRARATKQRFPVRQWVHDLEELQSSAIDISHKQAAKEMRPTLDSPNTPAIMDTPGVLSVIQSRFKPQNLRPGSSRSALTQAPSETEDMNPKGLSDITEGHLLAGPGPGLGSKMGPTSRRKRPPPPLESNIKDTIPTSADSGVGTKPRNLRTRTGRPFVVGALSFPNDLLEESEEEHTVPKGDEELLQPAMKQEPPIPGAALAPTKWKAVKLLGMQLPANQAAALEHSKVTSSSPSSADLSSPLYSSSFSPLSPYTPATSSSADSRDSTAQTSPQATTTDTSKRTSFVTISPSKGANFAAISPFKQTTDDQDSHTSPPQRPTAASRSSSSKRDSLTALRRFTFSGGNRDSLKTASALYAPDAPADQPTSQRRRPSVAAQAKRGSIAVAKAAIAKVRRSPAIDFVASKGSHFFPHGADTELSASGIKEEKPDNKLQNVMPFFSDPQQEYEDTFVQKLEKLNGTNSENKLCIEEYLLQSEKSWFGRLRAAELSRAPAEKEPATAMVQEIRKKAKDDGLDSARNHKPPSGLKRIMRRKIGNWPIYSFLLAFGQIIAANSYQLTLLSGTVGDTGNKLYVFSSIYLVTSVIWWILYRRLQTVFVVSLPFLFYGLAFFLIAMSPLVVQLLGRNWMHNVATAFYALGSSSGAIFFAVNFADEGGAPVTDWTYRACVIQGTQQLYVVALWYWGAALAKSQGTASVVANLNSYPEIIIPVCVIVACVMWGVGAILFIGLPPYYRQKPGNIPSFYKSLLRRKIIVWFFISVIFQNYWLSAPYGRNWIYLWSNQAVPAWGIFLLILLFFVGVWIIILFIFRHMSKSHSWILPVFAMGLGAPRWAQILWSTSNMGHYLPWAAGPVVSGLASRSLWLWLGVLDAVQGVGFGMILLQTLTRFHVLFVLIAAQVLGSATTMIARASAPDKIGPNGVFPNLCDNPREGLAQGWFWVALLFQLAIPVGFAFFFRKEQLGKA